MPKSVRTCAVFLAMLGACHDDAAPPPPAAALAEAVPAAPKPKLDLSLGEGYEMRRPLRDGRLAVIPIVATASTGVIAYTSLATAVANHDATVREMPGEWRVDTVRIRNRGRATVVAYMGEMIIDAKQDRVLAETKVIPPGASEDVAVRCVEQSRENGSRTFTVPGIMVEMDLRRVVAFRPQVDVWTKVDAINNELGLSPPSKTYRLAAQRMASGDLEARRGRLAAELAAHPDRDRIVGLAEVVDGEVIAIDRFATPSLYREEEQELLGAYVASSGGVAHEGRTFLPADVRGLATTPGAIWSSEGAFTALRQL